MAKAKFKTALGQRTVIVNCYVNQEAHVGDLVTLSNGSSLTLATSFDVATHIVALSDMTISGMINYIGDDYSDVVKMSSKAKNVGLYPIIDKADLIVSGTYPEPPSDPS